MSAPLGFLNIDKPSGWTSRDVVNRVQRLVRPAKAGHAGTLDPLATGVLVVGVGAATRLVEYLQASRKRYRGTFLLGRESDTEDVEGEVGELIGPPTPAQAEIEQVLPRFLGTLLQRPPAYSALKVQGRRAYDMARKGEAVELAPRPIEVFSLSLVAYEYPELTLDIECGGGTYVRSLGRDIAIALGTAAVMSALVRTAVGPFLLADAVSLESLTPDNIASYLQPAVLAVSDWPQVTLDEAQLLAVRQGKRITLPDVSETKELASLTPDGQLAAILTLDSNTTWKPAKVFMPCDTSPPAR